jgi:hypothetical protein
MTGLSPELQAALDKANAAYDAMTPEQKAAMWCAQRESWVVGEMMLEHSEMTREQAKAIYDKVVF